MPISPEEQFRNFLLKRSHYLAQLENGVLQNMVAPYAKARVKINEKLNTIGEGFTKEARLARLNMQIAEIDGLLQSAALDASGELKYKLQELIFLDSDTYAQMLDSQFGKIGVNINSLPLRQIDQIMNQQIGQIGLDGSIEQKMFWANNTVKSTIRNELTQSIIQGEDMQRAVARLTGKVDTPGIIATTFGLSPLDKIVKNKAEIVARTEIQKASNEVARQTFMENQDVLKGMQWSSALDRRTCLLANTLIDIANGKKKISDINIGDLVLTHEGRYKKVIAKRVQKRNKYLKVELSNGKIINVTEDHGVLTKYGWTEIGKLNKGDIICGMIDGGLNSN